jgi:hypothetical protein
MTIIQGEREMAVDVRPLTLAEIEERLEGFEARFKLPTAEFVLAFRNGQLQETDEFREWAMLQAARKVATRQH